MARMGGNARSLKLSPETRITIAKKGARARWRMSLGRVAQITLRNPNDFRFALREFFRSASRDKGLGLIEREPAATSRIEYDAYLAAVAEGVAVYYRLDIPTWVNSPNRVLHRPYYGNAPAGMRIPLLQESPVYFRKHNIFVDAGEVNETLRKYELGLEAMSGG